MQVTEFEQDNDITDTDYLTVEPDQSQLRLQNARLDGDDQRYAGKKTSRKKLAKQQGLNDEDNVEDGEDIREHAAAELGHMFDGYEDDDDEIQGEQEDYSEEEEGVEGSEGEEDEVEGESIEDENEGESDEDENEESDVAEDEG